MIKNRNSKDLTEAEDIKNRWKDTQKKYTKFLNNHDNHNGVVTHIELDIMEYKVKWAL